MAQHVLPADRAVHSDFLIHWTGKDIDSDEEPQWFDLEHRSKTGDKATERYLSRLCDILRFGLWMTEEGSQFFQIGGAAIDVPAASQTCFTELKLSESRRHAREYGRLGIGVKRPFLFNRFGRPMTHFGYSTDRHKDKFLEACAAHLPDKRLLNYFKPMNGKARSLTYEFYAESEWRLLFFEELLSDRRIVDPRDPANSDEHAYFNTLTAVQQAKLKYLVPLDGWFSMIIYPSIRVKNCAQWDEGCAVRDEIRRIKTRSDPGNRVEGLREPFRGNWPIEVNLDACSHF